MINLFEIKELSVHGGHNAKPVIALIDENGCWEIISHRRNSDGYISLKRKQKHIIAHRLAYEIFIGTIPDGLHVLHNCDNPPCANPEHLFLGTNLDNMEDKVKKCRQYRPRGVENGSAKINDDLVREIREQHSANQYSQWQLADIFGVSRPTISAIVNWKSWKHVEV